jgi:integrase
MIEVAAWTGLRPGELFLLARRPSPSDDEASRVNWVDFRTGEIVVDWQLNSKTRRRGIPKWDSRRRVALLPAAERALMSLPDDGTAEPIFRTQRGKVFTQRTQFYYWDAIRTAFTAQLPAGHWLRQRIQRDPENGNLDFYELRHFFGTKLAQPPGEIRAATPYEIAQQMGHKDGGQLAYARYVHLNVDVAIKSLRSAWVGGDEAGRAAAKEAS